MSESHAVTSLDTAPDVERKQRMVKYSLAMGVRLVCIGACFVVSGWWLLIPALGAIALPYFAVIVANQVSKKPQNVTAYRPGVVVRYESSPQ